MDYGQPVNPDNNQPFFTADSGTNLEKAHTAEDDFNSNSWDVSTERDNRELGNAAISSSEMIDLPLPGENPENNHELGEVITPAITSTPTPENVSVAPAQNATKETSHGEVKTEENISKSAVKIIEDEFDKFNKTGNATELYTVIRGEGGLTDQNLKNSYDRELGKAA